MPHTKRWLMWLCGILSFTCLMSNRAKASENATFECAAGASQTCYFSILRQPGPAQSFAVQGHQRTAIAGVAPGRDWYLVAVGQAAPAGIDACKHASFRCKVGIVRRGTNQ